MTHWRGRVNALGVPPRPPHSKNESVRLWRLLGDPVSASLPNSLELTLARCSGSAALSSRTRSRPEAGQTVAAADSIQKDSGLSQGLDSLSHPGRNLTGINLFLAEVAAKRLEFLLVLVPGVWLWH